MEITIIWKYMEITNIWKYMEITNIWKYMEITIIWKYMEITNIWKYKEITNIWKYMEITNIWKYMEITNIWNLWKSPIYENMEITNIWNIWKSPIYENIRKYMIHYMEYLFSNLSPFINVFCTVVVRLPGSHSDRHHREVFSAGCCHGNRRAPSAQAGVGEDMWVIWSRCARRWQMCRCALWCAVGD